MVIDTSALLAVLLAEPEAEAIARAIAADPRRLLSARRAYGKGRHPPGLTVGDCCSCALARCRGEPLLFKGEASAKMDVHGVQP